MPPAFGPAFGLALRALGREAWLLAAGVAVAALRRALTWPAFTVLWALVARAAVAGAHASPLDPLAGAEGALAAVTSTRVLGLVGGLWLAGAALGAALRVAWLAGAFPVLGAAMAGAEGGTRRFEAGVAYGFPRVLGASVLAVALEAGGALFGLTLALAAALVTVHGAGAASSPLLAGAVALALVLALLVPTALSAAADAGVARAALRGEAAPGAFAAATRRFLARPGTFVLAALGFGLAGALGPGTVEALGDAVTGFAHGAAPVLLLGPGIMLALLAAVVSAVIDLAWLGTIAALACASEPVAPRGAA
jgi:hypothetical protein